MLYLFPFGDMKWTNYHIIFKRLLQILKKSLALKEINTFENKEYCSAIFLVINVVFGKFWYNRPLGKIRLIYKVDIKKFWVLKYKYIFLIT